MKRIPWSPTPQSPPLAGLNGKLHPIYSIVTFFTCNATPRTKLPLMNATPESSSIKPNRSSRRHSRHQQIPTPIFLFGRKILHSHGLFRTTTFNLILCTRLDSFPFYHTFLRIQLQRLLYLLIRHFRCYHIILHTITCII